MDSWLIPGLIIITVVLIIGSFSTVQKNAKTPLRRKGLNDLEETLPRSNKTEDQKESFKRKF